MFVFKSKFQFMAAVTLLFLLGSYSCVAEPTSEDNAAFAAGSHFGDKFALKLFGVTDKSHGNTLLSPLSAYLALCMAFDGAAGQTADGMVQGLQLSTKERDYLDQQNQVLVARFNKTKEVQIANALFADDAYPFKPSYVSNTQKIYGAIAESLPLHNPASIIKINQWVSAHTEAKIPKMIDHLDGEVKLLLINALYFKGKWQHKFDKNDTTNETFFEQGGKHSQVKMMHSSDELFYAKERNFEFVKIPYAGQKLTMCIVLPNKGVDFVSFCNQMKPEVFEFALKHLSSNKVKLSLPKFSLSSESKLNDALCALGMTQAFDNQKADFSKLCTAKVWISKVLQKAIMDVDEDGTTAAAATVIESSSKGMHFETQEVNLVINHPFIVAIRDEASGHLLFLGSVLQPGIK